MILKINEINLYHFLCFNKIININLKIKLDLQIKRIYYFIIIFSFLKKNLI